MTSIFLGSHIHHRAQHDAASSAFVHAGLGAPGQGNECCQLPHWRHGRWEAKWATLILMQGTHTHTHTKYDVSHYKPRYEFSIFNPTIAKTCGRPHQLLQMFKLLRWQMKYLHEPALRSPAPISLATSMPLPWGLHMLMVWRAAAGFLAS